MKNDSICMYFTGLYITYKQQDDDDLLNFWRESAASDSKDLNLM